MRMSRMTVPLAAAMAIGALALSPAVASTPPAASGLCAAGVGVGGGLHGTVVEPCDASHSEAFTPMAGISRIESPPPPAFEALMVAISSLVTHRILMHNALIFFIP